MKTEKDSRAKEGMRIKMISMTDDPNPILMGTEGTINFVDDMGIIHVKWDDGRVLGVIPGVDKYRLLESANMNIPKPAKVPNVKITGPGGKKTRTPEIKVKEGEKEVTKKSKKEIERRNKRLRSEETKSKSINESVSEISNIVNQYIGKTEYDIQNSLGNCSFFTRDMLNWANKNGVKADYVYMPMSEEYRKTNNISDSEWEDHIVPMINGVIIDFAYTPQGVSKNVRTSNTIPPKLFNYNDNLFKPNGVYGKFGYTKPEINTEYGNPKNINSFNVVEPNNKKEDLSELKIYESINKIAGVWDTNEKFEDGGDFKIKFKVSDVIELTKNLPVKNIDPKKINYNFSGRQEDPTKTKDRVNKADLSYPIIVVKNENGKIFAMLDGTHRLEKALSLGLDSIKVKILNKKDLIQFKTDSLDEAKKTRTPEIKVKEGEKEVTKKSKKDKKVKTETTMAAGGASTGAYVGPMGATKPMWGKGPLTTKEGVKETTIARDSKIDDTSFEAWADKNNDGWRWNDTPIFEEGEIVDPLTKIKTSWDDDDLDISKEWSKTQRLKKEDLFRMVKTRLNEVKKNKKSNKKEEVEELEETTTFGSALGTRTPVGPAFAAKQGEWTSSKKTMYPGGKIVQKIDNSGILNPVNEVNNVKYNPGGKFVKVKKKCTKFPYCNQGAIDNPLDVSSKVKGDGNYVEEQLMKNVHEVAMMTGKSFQEVYDIIKKSL